MKNLLKRIIILGFAIELLVISTHIYLQTKNPSTVRAFGDIIVDFHVPPGDPIFTINNMVPGDMVTKPVDVTNNGTLTKKIAVKADKDSGIGNNPRLERGLIVTISQGGVDLYGGTSGTGKKTLRKFFEDSEEENGVNLGKLNPSQTKQYDIKVEFPASAGNQYQGKLVQFDLSFGTITINSLVINEVYYDVDATHGLDNGEHIQKNHEWVEIYNPTSDTISLREFSLTDNSGIRRKFHTLKKLKPGEFALISRNNSTWNFWSEPSFAVKVELGREIGDGLQNLGDRLILKDSDEQTVDEISYGSDTSVFTLGGVLEGHSLERSPDGTDTDTSGDWVDTNPPTPGS